MQGKFYLAQNRSVHRMNSDGWRIVLTATLYNLLFEYSIRSVYSLSVKPLLPLFLFLVYFSYFTILEALIVKYRLRDRHVVLLTVVHYSVYSTLFLPGTFLYLPPLILGVNWFTYLWVNVFWWIFIQTLLALYFANRIRPRDWNHGTLSRRGWVLTLAVYVGVGLVFRAVIKVPFNLLGTVVTWAIGLLAALLFIRSIKEERDTPVFRRSVFLDGVLLFVLVSFVISAFLLPYQPGTETYHPVNLPSAGFQIVCTAIAAVCMMAYRLVTRREIPV